MRGRHNHHSEFGRVSPPARAIQPYPELESPQSVIKPSKEVSTEPTTEANTTSVLHILQYYINLKDRFLVQHSPQFGLCEAT